jgi:hypothetical protein
LTEWFEETVFAQVEKQFLVLLELPLLWPPCELHLVISEFRQYRLGERETITGGNACQRGRPLQRVTARDIAVFAHGFALGSSFAKLKQE